MTTPPACAWIDRDEVFDDYVREALPVADRDAFETHYFGCGACFDRLLATRVLRAELTALPAIPPAAAPARAWAWRWVLTPLAATLVCAATALLWFRHPAGPASPRTIVDAPAAPASTAAAPGSRAPAAPGAPPATVSAVPTPATSAPASSVPRPRDAVRKPPAAASTLVLLSPSENETRPLESLDFSWRTFPGAAYYDLHIVSEAGNVVWVGKAQGASVRLPGDHQLQAGQKYFAWVRAHLSSGGTVKSPAVPFRVSER